MKTSPIAILLLAAGASSRMGTIKQLLPWKGTFLINHMLKVACASNAAEVVVVLGANAEEIRKVLGTEAGGCILENELWAKGLGKSISLGIEYLMENHPGIQAVLVMLCDQPLIEAGYLNRMMAGFHEGKGQIIATAYGENMGVPALFSAPYFTELQSLEDDFGARELLKKHKKEIFALSPGNILVDIDTPQDYERLLGQ